MMFVDKLRWVLLAGLLAWAAAGLAGIRDWFGAAPAFLPVDEAFALSAQIDGEAMLVARWVIAEGYYLYRHRFDFKTDEGVEPILGGPRIEPGREKVDEYFGAVEVYYGDAEARVPVLAPAERFRVGIVYQGCAEAGLCYPPQTRWFSVDVGSRLVAATASELP